MTEIILSQVQVAEMGFLQSPLCGTGKLGTKIRWLLVKNQDWHPMFGPK